MKVNNISYKFHYSGFFSDEPLGLQRILKIGIFRLSLQNPTFCIKNLQFIIKCLVLCTYLIQIAYVKIQGVFSKITQRSSYLMMSGIVEIPLQKH